MLPRLLKVLVWYLSRLHVWYYTETISDMLMRTPPSISTLCMAPATHQSIQNYPWNEDTSFNQDTKQVLV